MSAARIAYLRQQHDKILDIMADDVLVVIILQSDPAKLARYDALMAQPRLDLQASFRAIKAELAELEGK